jgi:outer membrane protein
MSRILFTAPRMHSAAHRHLSVAVLVMAAAASSVHAQVATPRGALSLDSAIDLALENNPGYLQQKSEVGVAHSALRSAYGSLVPSASASAGFGYTAPGQLRYQSQELGNQPDFYSSDYGVRLSYQVNGTSLLQPAVERSRLRATERRVEGVQAQLVSEVTRQYLLLLQARERHAQAQREVERTAEHVRLAEGRLAVGAGTPLDVRRAEVQHGQSEVRLVQAENTAAMEVLRLNQLLGVPLPFGVELSSRFEVFAPVWTPDELIQRALNNNPGILATRANSDAASTSARAARSQYLPTLSMNVGVTGSAYQAGNVDPLIRREMDRMQAGYGSCVSQNEIRARVGLGVNPCTNPADAAVQEQIRQAVLGSNSSFPFGYTRQPLQASVGISIPLFTGLNRQHQVEVARASADDAKYQVRAEELRLQQEVTSAVLELGAAHRTSLLQERVRERAEEELRLATERFRFGAATSVEVTDAQTNLSQAEIEKIEAAYNFHRSLAALEALIGEQLR